MLYKLLVNNYIKKQGLYNIKKCGDSIILYRHNEATRRFNNWEECYNFLKMMRWLELI